MIVKYATLCTALALCPRAQTENDVGGWGTTKWGMTEEQVISAVPGTKRLSSLDMKLENPPLPPGGASLMLSNTVIDDVTYKIFFGFNEDRLFRVIVVP